MGDTTSTSTTYIQAALSVSEPSDDSHSVSPLEPLDPYRLRDMVVNKQGNGSHTGSLPSNWSSPQSAQVAVESLGQSQAQSSKDSQVVLVGSSCIQSPAGQRQFPQGVVEHSQNQHFSQQQHYAFTQSGNYTPLQHGQQQSEKSGKTSTPNTPARLATPQNANMPGQNSPRTTPQHGQSPFAQPPRVASATSSIASPFSASTPAQQQFMQQFPPRMHHGPIHQQIVSPPMSSPAPSPSPQTYGSVLMSGMQQRVLPSYPTSSHLSSHYPFMSGVQPQWISQQIPQHYVVNQQSRIIGHPLPQSQQQRFPMSVVRSAYPMQTPSGVPTQMMYLPQTVPVQPALPVQQSSPVMGQSQMLPQREKPQGRQLQQQKSYSLVNTTLGGMTDFHQPNTSGITSVTPQHIIQTQFSVQQPQQQQSSSMDYSPSAFMVHQQQQQRFVLQQQQNFTQINPQQQIQQQIAAQQFYQQQQFSRQQTRTGIQPSGYPMGAGTAVSAASSTPIAQIIGVTPNPISAQTQVVGIDGFVQPQTVRYTASNNGSTAQPLPLSSIHLQQQKPTLSPLPYHQQHQQNSIATNTTTGVAACGAVVNNTNNMRSPTIVSSVVPVARLPLNSNPGALCAVQQTTVAAATAVQQQHQLQHQILQQQMAQQQPSSANTVVSRHITPGNTTQIASPAIGVPFHQMRVSSQFCGVEFHGGLRYSADIFLAGCVFLIMEEFPLTQIDRHALSAVIRFHGGDVETQTARGIPDRVTHVICATVGHNDIVMHQALNDRRKRIVTFHWLNEAIMKRRIEAPTKACHLPTCWSEHSRPAFGKVISIAGFDALEATNLKFMLRAIGAKYVEKLSPQCHILIAKNTTCAEVETAQQFLPQPYLLNYQWLVEVYFGSVRALNDLENTNYSPLNQSAQFDVCVSPYALERVSDFCQKLLYSWRLPIPLNGELIERAYELKKAVEKDKFIFPHRQFKCEGEAPSEEQISKASEIFRSSNYDVDVRVHFDGLLPEQIDYLSRKLRFLGGILSKNVADCTHFVAPNLERTVKLAEALARGKMIVSPTWILSSFLLLQLLDAFDFFIYDPENERKYGFNLKNTVFCAKHRGIFEDVTIHLSASVFPPYNILKRLIVAAGGIVDVELPKPKKLAKCIENDNTFLIVVNENDLPSYQYLINCNFPIFTEELVLMAILRHEIDVSANFRLPIPLQFQKLAAAAVSAETPAAKTTKASVATAEQMSAHASQQQIGTLMRPERVVKAS